MRCAVHRNFWGSVLCSNSDWQQLLYVCLYGNRCHPQASPVRAALAAAARSGAALLSSAHRATAVRVSPLLPHQTMDSISFKSTDCVTLSFSLCRSPECCRVSWAGEHARLDLHSGQHFCSWRTRGLYRRHSQINPRNSGTIHVGSQATSKKANWLFVMEADKQSLRVT